MNPRLISIDWGSTNCRASLLLDNGATLEHRTGWPGVLDRQVTRLSEQLREMVEPWREEYGALPVIVSGMAGSRSGLQEVPYLGCPAGIADLASALRRIDPEILPDCWIVPGLKGRTPQDLPDVMRGEEVQIIGLLEQQVQRGKPLLFVLPGTHCKWVLAGEGKVRQFATTVSGELYAVLQRLGSLAAVGAEVDRVELDRDGFLNAVGEARQPGGLLHHLFGLRVGVLLGEFPSNELHSRLSALIIGHEIEAMLAMFPGDHEVLVIAEQRLGELYCRALALNGIGAAFTNSRTATALGVAKIACAGGILT